MRLIWASLALLSLSGCALPPALTFASLALDISSYALTGKGTIDHGISMVAQQDCAVLQLTQGHLCREPSRYEAQELAALTPLPAAAHNGQLAAYYAPATTPSSPTDLNRATANDQALAWAWPNLSTRMLPTSNPSVFVAANYAQSLAPSATSPTAPPTTPPAAPSGQPPVALPPQSASILVITGEGLTQVPHGTFLPTLNDAEG